MTDPIEEMRKKQSHEFEKVLQGCWVTLRKEGVRYMGRIVDAKTKEEALKLSNNSVLLNPCLEVIIQFQQAPGGRIAKLPMVLPIGMLGGRVDVRLNTPAEVVFFEDMTQDDLDLHKNLVTDGLLAMKHTRLGDVSELEPRIIAPGARAPDQNGRR